MRFLELIMIYMMISDIWRMESPIGGFHLRREFTGNFHPSMAIESFNSKPLTQNLQP